MAIDEDLYEALQKSDRRTLDRIIEYLESSPVISIKSENEYTKNKENPELLLTLIEKKFLTAGNIGVFGIEFSRNSYRKVALECCRIAGMHVVDTMTSIDAERVILKWIFEKAKEISTDSNSSEIYKIKEWDGKSYPSQELIEFARNEVVLKFRDPNLQAVAQRAFVNANDDIGDLLSFVNKNIIPVQMALGVNPAAFAKKYVPEAVLSAVGLVAGFLGNSIPGLGTEVVGASAALPAVATTAGLAAGTAAGAYAALIGLYAGMSLAGPALAALFPCVFELSLSRLDSTLVEGS